MAPEGTREIVFWIADKVVIALLLAIATFVFNHLLVRSKAKLAFGNEVAKQRVIQIGKVWSSLYESEAAARELLRSASETIAAHGGDAAELKKLIPLENESKQKAKRAQQIAEANRFWLGETLYDRTRAFHNAQMQMIAAVGSVNPPAIQASEVKLEKARMSVINFIDNPL